MQTTSQDSTCKHGCNEPQTIIYVYKMLVVYTHFVPLFQRDEQNLVLTNRYTQILFLTNHLPKTQTKMKTFVSQYIITMMGLTHTQAMLSSPHPYHEVQPDGETILLKIQGDPFDSYVSDMDGKFVTSHGLNDTQLHRLVV